MRGIEAYREDSLHKPQNTLRGDEAHHRNSRNSNQEGETAHTRAGTKHRGGAGRQEERTQLEPLTPSHTDPAGSSRMRTPTARTRGVPIG